MGHLYMSGETYCLLSEICSSVHGQQLVCLPMCMDSWCRLCFHLENLAAQESFTSLWLRAHQGQV